MSSNLREQIYGNMNLKDTEELLSIWQTNNRSVWTDDAMEVVEEILKKRNVDLPLQEAPVYKEMEDEKTEFNIDGFTEEELKIIDDEYPPEFYDPLDVLLITKRIELAAVVLIFLVAVSTIIRFPEGQNLMESYLQSYPPLIPFAFPLTAISVTIGILMAVITTYFPLKALARVLRILMEMEFASRK